MFNISFHLTIKDFMNAIEPQVLYLSSVEHIELFALNDRFLFWSRIFSAKLTFPLSVDVFVDEILCVIRDGTFEQILNRFWKSLTDVVLIKMGLLEGYPLNHHFAVFQ